MLRPDPLDVFGLLSTILAGTKAGGEITDYYVYGMGLISKVNSSGESYYYHYDGIGSTVGMSDSSGNIVNRYAYDAFGKVLNQEETIPNSFKYVGQFGVMNEGNGLLYMRARYYDPEVGRFISKDPIGFFGGDVNFYAYVANNPMNDIDPLGLWAIKVSGYWGYGGSVSFGSEGGKWFVRAAGGFGAGGGFRFYPAGGFPVKPECTTGFIGASGNLGAALGPLSGEIKGEAGLVITMGPDGRPQLRYIEQGGVQGSLKGTTGWGVSLGGNINIIDVGIAW